MGIFIHLRKTALEILEKAKYNKIKEGQTVTYLVAGGTIKRTFIKRNGKLVPIKSEMVNKKKRGRKSTEDKKETFKEQVEGLPNGAEIGECAGMKMKKDNDNIILFGNTWSNYNVIKTIQQKLGIGVWNKETKAWEFPFDKSPDVLTILSSFFKSDFKINQFNVNKEIQDQEKKIEKKEESGETDDEDIEKKENLHKARRKNRLNNGKKVKVNGTDTTVVDYDPDKEKVKVTDGTEEKEVDEAEVEVDPVTDDKKAQELLESANPENRNLVANELAGKGKGTAAEFLAMPKMRDYYQEFGGLKNPNNNRMYSGIDYTSYPHNSRLCTKKEIESDTPPDFILPFDKDMLVALVKANGYKPSYVMLDDNTCLVVDGRYGKNYGDSEQQSRFIKCNIGDLVSTVDYHLRRDTFEYKKKVDEMFNIVKEKFKTKDKGSAYSLIRYLYPGDKLIPDEPTEEDIRIIKKYIKRESKHLKPKVIHATKTSWDNMLFITDYYGISQREAWSTIREQNELFKQKSLDLKCHFEDYESSYAKASETSFGEKNAQDDLLASHGVKIKRQNGKPLTPEDIKVIRTALDQNMAIYGNKSQTHKQSGLKVAYTGDKMIFARKAIGLFHPYYMTVSFGSTDKGSNGMTLAHELAHYYDYQIGKSRNQGGFATDNYSSPEAKIAKAFRSEMQKGKGAGNYWYRTTECLARALEQYLHHKQSGEKDYTLGTWYVPKAQYETKVKPIVEQWLKETHSLLKSFTVKQYGTEVYLLSPSDMKEKLEKAKYLRREGGPGHYKYFYKPTHNNLVKTKKSNHDKLIPLKDLTLDSKIEKEDGYYYHVTNEENYLDILNSGKLDTHKPNYGTEQDSWPDGSVEKRSYFVDDPKHIMSFAPSFGKPVVLRVKSRTNIIRETTGDYYSNKPIKISEIEYLGNDDKWHTVTKIKKVDS